MAMTSARRPPVGEPTAEDTPAFDNQWHAQNYLWLRARRDACDAELATDSPYRLICACSAFTLSEVVARMAEPQSELRTKAIELRGSMSVMLADVMREMGSSIE